MRRESELQNRQKISGRYEQLETLYKRSKLGGGEEKIKNQHAKGKLTARERIELLLDEGSFVEIDAFRVHKCDKFGMEKNRPLGDGVVTGYGTINGRTVFVYSQDFTVFGGSLGKVHAEKIAKIMDLAVKAGAPIIGILDSGGARIQEGVESLAGYGEIFYRNVRASGVVPQISIVFGPCAGGAVYSPALTDFIFMTEENAFMFVTGPEVVKAVTNEDVSFYDLGGSEVHSKVSGVCHFVGETEDETIEQVKKLLSYIPQNNLDDPPYVNQFSEEPQSKLQDIIPLSENEPYNMRSIIEIVLDKGTFFEVQPTWAKNIIVGFGRLAGHTVGIIANQPLFLGGAITHDSADKAARFIRFCDSFNIPIITFVDVPGFMPGLKEEHAGIIRHGAKMLYAYSEATVPKLAVIVRKAYGGAYIVMSSKHLGGDLNLAWPTAEIAVMGAEGACKILYRRKLKEAEDPEKELANFVQQYKETFATPYQAAENGYVDKVILPHETRKELITALYVLQGKREDLPRRKHGNIPL